LNQLNPRTFLRSPFGRTLSAIMVAFTLIPIVILTAISLYNVQVQLQERALTQADTVADLIQQTTTQWIGEASAQLASTLKSAAVVQNSSFILLATTTDVSRAEQALSRDLGALATGAYFSATYLVRPDDSIALASQADLKGQKLRIGLAQLEQSGKRLWGFDQSPLLNQRVAFIWQPVLDQRQQVLGFLVGQISIKGLSSVFQKNAVGLGQTGEIYLADDDEVPFTELRFPSSDIPARLPVDHTGDTAFSGLFSDYANRAVVGTVQPLQVPLQGWLVVHQQQVEAFDTFYRLIRIVALLAVGLFVLAILAAVITTQWISDPLRRLSTAAQSMAGGDLAARVDVKRRDEFGSLATSFNSMAVELEDTFNVLENSNRKLATRAEQLDAITRVSQHATSFLDLESLCPMLAKEIQQAFGYYAVAVFLPDDTSALVGKAAAGVSADEFMAMMTRREIAQTSLVGTAASTHQMVSVPDVTKDSRYVAHPLRPATKSEVSVPLMVSTRLVGVLDIQSDTQSAFSQEELDILQILANQIAIAIRNADLFGEATAAREAADEANRQKSEFLSNMSHELRTPLNVIIGYSHSILNRPAMYNHVALPSVYEQGIRSIMTSGQHLLGLINDILDLSKIEAGQIDLDIEPVDPLPILQGIRSTALGLIKSDITLRADYPEKLPDILGDELRIRQILLNLVSNAAKFTEHGFITLDARVKDDKLVFTVADTGPGIATEAKPYLFDRFRQAGREVTRKHGGSGLGLSISRQLCEMHGGEIWFESEVGKGTTFFFTIPLSKGVERETRPVPPPGLAEEISARAEIFVHPEAQLQQALVIDTQADSRSKIRAALVDAKYDVLIVDDAERGLEMAEIVLPNVLVINVHPGDPAAMIGLADKCRQNAELVKQPIVVLNDVQEPGESFVADHLMKLQTAH
jgi:signal transduction histidine kinase